MARYAEGTTVAADRSRLELERLLQKFGADQFAAGWDGATGSTMVAFRLSGRQVRLDVWIPPASSDLFWSTPAGRKRSATAAHEEYEKEVRRRWRSLVAVVKAKLVAVEEGISTLEREFLADMVTGDGRTVEQVIRPLLDSDGPLQLDQLTRKAVGR